MEKLWILPGITLTERFLDAMLESEAFSRVKSQDECK
jgi:hypothetical protein